MAAVEEDPLGDLDGIQLGFDPELLAKQFLAYLQTRPEVHGQVRQFQTDNSGHFINAVEKVSSGEHSLIFTDVHRRFVELMESFIAGFLSSSGCTEEMFISALRECKEMGSPLWTPFSVLLDTTDYEGFARMLQDNVCLCCGGTFVTDEEQGKFVPFKGYWNADGDGREMGYVHDGILIWSARYGASNTPLKMIPPNQLEMEMDGQMHVATLEVSSDGEPRLHWSDGEVWRRAGPV